MNAFIAGFNGKAYTDSLLKAAIAHLWFVTVHPLEDGNGRIAKCSQDTATRDIDVLIRRGILVKEAAGGRSTRYSLAAIASISV